MGDNELHHGRCPCCGQILRKPIVDWSKWDGQTLDPDVMRAAMSAAGRAGVGTSKRRNVDYSALAKKAHEARRRNAGTSSGH